jgi:hypothetical protein
MLKKAILKLGLFCRIAQRADPCSFATIPNALKSRPGGTRLSQLAPDHSLRSLVGFLHSLK